VAEVARVPRRYDCLGFNANAVDAICEYYDFTPGVKYYLFDGGYDTLLWKIQEELEQHGGKVRTGRWLEGFDEAKLPDGSGGVALSFRGEEKERTARVVVLAMPRRSLELLAQRGPVMDPKRSPGLRHMMNAADPVMLYKMFIAYDEPWWDRAKSPPHAGRALTDLPIRQCYYWGVDEKTGNAILMVYNDAQSAEFWGGLRRIPLGPGDTARMEGAPRFERKKSAKVDTGRRSAWDERLLRNWKEHEAPAAMVKEMHRQLTILHDAPGAPKPIDAAFMDWGDDPFGGAVHFWNPGYRSSEVMKGMIQPVKGFPCYICGEAYSQHQTWVEGAFQTAELVLRKFDIPAPSWLTPSG
jgi:hypothetical protein